MENLNAKDRVIRTTIGSSLLLSMLVLPLSPLLVAASSLASFYPLLTALIAWDPAYHLVLKAVATVKKADIPAMEPSVK